MSKTSTFYNGIVFPCSFVPKLAFVRLQNIGEEEELCTLLQDFCFICVTLISTCDTFFAPFVPCASSFFLVIVSRFAFLLVCLLPPFVFSHHHQLPCVLGLFLFLTCWTLFFSLCFPWFLLWLPSSPTYIFSRSCAIYPPSLPALFFLFFASCMRRRTDPNQSWMCYSMRSSLGL